MNPINVLQKLLPAHPCVFPGEKHTAVKEATQGSVRFSGQRGPVVAP